MSRSEIDKIELQCDLTQEELLKYATEMAEATRKVNRLEDSKKSYNDQIKSQISESEGRLNLLCEKVASGKEFRMVECSVNYDWIEGIKRYYRKDTGEHVKDDIITESERQEKLAVN